MGIKDKIKNARKRRLADLSGSEKTGVLNGLVVLGAIAGAMVLTGKSASATACDPKTHDVTNTELSSTDGGISNSWNNHCWWDHSWHDHSWSDWSDSSTGPT